MTTKERIIVGIGDAVLLDHPDGDRAAGLAINVARLASQYGHRGVAISRLGQDAGAARLHEILDEGGVDIDRSMLQSDPDLPTGRAVVRRIAGSTRVRWDEYAAFDALQWDFDLVDIAHEASAVVFGGLARRHAQTRSVIDQFLDECRGVLRVYDVRNVAAQPIERGAMLAGLDRADVAVAGTEVLGELIPNPDDEVIEVGRRLLRTHDIALLVILDPGSPLQIISVDQVWTTIDPIPEGQETAAVVGMVHGILAGWEMPVTADFVARTTDWMSRHPGESLSETVLEDRA